MFFKTQGDLAGRKMLKKHQDFVSPAINEYGGGVVKVLGDSVMAYFLNAKEALKSAIKIQQTLHRFNLNRKPEEQIRVRICVHFGKGIVEEKDIFGDVVNTAAKFLPLVGGDQIVVSQEVFDLAKDLPNLQFKPVSISDQLASIRGMALFRVHWEEGLTFAPANHTLLYIRPLANFGKETLSEAWANLLRSKNRLWGGKVELETVLPDKSVVLLSKTPQVAMTLATHVMDFLKVNLGQLNEGFLASLNQLRPYGVGNPEPIFWAKARVLGNAREVGENHLQATLTDISGRIVYRAIGFGRWQALGGIMQGEVELAYTPITDEWNGMRQIQVRIQDVRSA